VPVIRPNGVATSVAPTPATTQKLAAEATPTNIRHLRRRTIVALMELSLHADVEIAATLCPC
jgi:hypothetical protein